MKKYRLANLDCAHCASEIEGKLTKLQSVDFVSVSFADSSMSIATGDVEEVVAEIERINPDIRVTEDGSDANDDAAGRRRARRNLVAILVALAIGVIGLVFQRTLHDTPGSIAEYLVFGVAYLLAGWGVLSAAFKNILRGRVFDENFLMALATLGAMAIHALPEAVGVMLFYRVGEYLEGRAVERSRRSIKSLLEIRSENATVESDGGYRTVPPDTVSVGQRILVRAGERVPLDGQVVSGDSQVDTSALTGESVPRHLAVGDQILAGMIATSGSLTVEVSRPFEESSISRIIDLVENAILKKAKTERFITTFARYYTPAIVVVAALIAFLPPLLFDSATLSDWIYRALVILVISCPCALVISIPLGYFGGIGGASRRGILIKGSNYIDVLAKVETVVFDKTGTLTEGSFEVNQVVPRNGFDADELLRWAAGAESHSNHPIAASIVRAQGGIETANAVSSHEEIPGFGVRSRVGNRDVIVGNDRLLHRENIEHADCGVADTVAYVVVDGVYAGHLVIGDKVKADSAAAVAQLKALGIRETVMLTGDSEQVARAVAEQLGIDRFAAELLPEEKARDLSATIRGAAGKVAFVGDGINDAPVLALADVGIAMGSLGSDVAVESADVVLMTDAPSKVPEAIGIARRTRRIIGQNVALALVVKLAFVGLGALGVAQMWEAVFADVGVTLLAVLNALRVLRYR